MWMIPRMVRWTLDMPIIEYNEEVVKPNIFEKEILMSMLTICTTCLILKLPGCQNRIQR